MAVRLKDIALRVGVKESTVSVVLNRKTTRIKVSDDTSNRIFEVAKELGYYPNASAKALITKRTGYIGFILSDTILNSWRNDYYAAHLTGVERACHGRGYGLAISQYNLSNISSFIFPARIGQRSVDGVVLIGYIQKEVANQFKKFGLPCICLGDDFEVANLMPTVSTQVVPGRFLAIKHLAELGHLRIGYPCLHSPRARQVYQLLCQVMKEDPLTCNCSLEFIGPPNPRFDYTDALPLFKQWMKMPAHDRPTAILHMDQTLITLERELIRYGLKCPEDLSLMSMCETQLCESGIPPLSSIYFDLERAGKIAGEMLIDYLINEGPLDSRFYEKIPAELKIRESCGIHS